MPKLTTVSEETYVIAQPIEGISLNGYEYLLDDQEEIMVFNSYDNAHYFVTECITDENQEDFIRATVDCLDLI